MLTLWLCIAATALVSFAIKAFGPATLGPRDLPPVARAVVALLAPALLTALVVSTVLGPRWEQIDPTVVAGVSAAGAARLLRAPVLVAILCAVATTAGLRLAL